MGVSLKATMGSTESAALPAPTAAGSRVLGTEIVQTIQNLRNEAPLIRGKATVVRVYLSTEGLGPNRVLRGDIAVSQTTDGPARYISSANAIRTSVGPAPSLAALRAAVDGSLNFVLPAQALTGDTVSVRLFRLYDSQGDVAFDGAAASSALVVSGPVLYIHAVGLRYIWRKPDGTSVAVVPEAFHFDHLKSFLKRSYPISDVRWSQSVVQADPLITPPFEAAPPADPDPVWQRQLDRVHNQLSALRAKDIESGLDPRTHYYGMISDASAGLFFRGAAKDIPATPDPSVVAVGPTGNPRQYPGLQWDSSASYGGWYGTHELSHAFGRYHPGFCGQDASDPAFPHPDGRIGDVGHGDMVGFDTGDGALGIPMRVMSNDQSHDIMTYCDYQWISSYTYLAVLDRLRQEVAQFGPVA